MTRPSSNAAGSRSPSRPPRTIHAVSNRFPSLSLGRPEMHSVPRHKHLPRSRVLRCGDVGLAYGQLLQRLRHILPRPAAEEARDRLALRVVAAERDLGAGVAEDVLVEVVNTLARDDHGDPVLAPLLH